MTFTTARSKEEDPHFSVPTALRVLYCPSIREPTRAHNGG